MQFIGWLKILWKFLIKEFVPWTLVYLTSLEVVCVILRVLKMFSQDLYYKAEKKKKERKKNSSWTKICLFFSYHSKIFIWNMAYQNLWYKHSQTDQTIGTLCSHSQYDLYVDSWIGYIIYFPVLRNSVKFLYYE